MGSVSSPMGAIFILLAVGTMIGAWNMAGTIPTIVSYGPVVLRSVIFFAAVAVICASPSCRRVCSGRHHKREVQIREPEMIGSGAVVSPN